MIDDENKAIIEEEKKVRNSKFIEMMNDYNSLRSSSHEVFKNNEC
jgi:hypothetical protein